MRYYFQKENFISKLYDELMSAGIQPLVMYGTPDPNKDAGYCIDVTLEADDSVPEELVTMVINAHVAVEPPPPSTPFDRIALINFDETKTMEELVTKMKELQGALLELRIGGGVYGE